MKKTMVILTSFILLILFSLKIQAAEYSALRIDENYFVGIKKNNSPQTTEVFLYDLNTNNYTIINSSRYYTSLSSNNYSDCSQFPISYENFYNPDVNGSAGYVSYLKRTTTYDCHEEEIIIDPYDPNSETETRIYLTNSYKLEAYKYEISSYTNTMISSNGFNMDSAFSRVARHASYPYEDYQFRMTNNKICGAGYLGSSGSAPDLVCYDLQFSWLQQLTLDDHDFGRFAIAQNRILSHNKHFGTSNPSSYNIFYDQATMFINNQQIPSTNSQILSSGNLTTVSKQYRGFEIDCKTNNDGDDCAGIFHIIPPYSSNNTTIPTSGLSIYDFKLQTVVRVSSTTGHSDIDYLSNRNEFNVVYSNGGEAQDNLQGSGTTIRLYNSNLGTHRVIYSAPTFAHYIEQLGIFDTDVIFTQKDLWNSSNRNEVYHLDITTGNIRQILN